MRYYAGLHKVAYLYTHHVIYNMSFHFWDVNVTHFVCIVISKSPSLLSPTNKSEILIKVNNVKVEDEL